MEIKFGLRAKFTIASIVLVIFVAVILSSFFINYETYVIHRALVQRGVTLAANLGVNAGAWIKADNKEALNVVLDNVIEQPDVAYAFVQDLQGAILIKKGSGIDRLAQSLEFQKISREALAINELKTQYFGISKEKYYDIATPVTVGKEKIGVVRVGLSLNGAMQLEKKSQHMAILITTFILLGAALGTIMLAGIGIVPVQRLVEGTNRIAEGDLGYKVSVSGSDEIGLLADSFNRMSEDLKKSHRELIRSKEYTDNIIKSMLDMLVVVDAQGVIRTVNPATMRILGYSEEDLIGRSVDRIFAVEGNMNPRALMTKYMLKEGKLQDFEMSFRTKSGKGIPVLLSGAVMADKDGKLEGVVGIAKDIGDRKKAEEAIKESNERFFTLAANMPGMIYQFVLTLDGLMYFPYVSPGCRELFGLEPESIQEDAQKFINTIHPEDRESFDKSVLESARTLRPWRWEGRFYRGKETRWAQVASRPKRLDKGDIVWDGLLMDVSDRKVAQSLLELKTAMLEKLNKDLVENEKKLKSSIDDLKRAHEELKETQFQLHQAEKLKTIGRLASGVAHEVKNPLAIILQGITYVAKKIPEENKEVLEILKDIKYAVHRADDVIKGMLDFSSISVLSLQMINIHDVIDASLLLLRHELEHNQVKVVKIYSKQVPEVKADKNKMEQVFVNVLLNSVQAMAGGGTITLKTFVKRITPQDLDNKEEQTFFSVDDEVFFIEIEDTGPGIPEPILSHIFEPFFTTKIGKGGTGLGLPIIRNIVELHKGRVDVENRKEGGVRTTILMKV